MNGPVAQRSEPAPHKRRVGGSNPSGPTITPQNLTEAEVFFLDCVKIGEITVSRSGLITHVSTGHSDWAIGSGRYPKISKLDRINRKIRHIQCHRLVWLVFKGCIPEGYDVNHKNGDKTDYRLRNLELLTPSGNMHHAVKEGLLKSQCGVENGFSKFTREEVAVVKWLSLSGWNAKEIAARFDVSRQTIYNILKGENYRHIDPAAPVETSQSLCPRSSAG